MKFEEALKAMREGKKVISSSVIFPIFIADYTNSFGETYKAICFRYGDEIKYSTIHHVEIFAEDWEVVDE